MRIIRIGAIWCSSCIIMKSKFNSIASNYDIEVIDYDYDFNPDMVEKYQAGDILPVYINESNNTRIIGEVSKEDIIKFIEGD